MNTSGFMRGLLSKNMSSEKYLNHVVNSIGEEMSSDYGLFLGSINDDDKVRVEFVWKYFDNVIEIELEKDTIRELQNKSPYSLDRYIIEELNSKGMDIDQDRSQYISTCYL